LLSVVLPVYRNTVLLEYCLDRLLAAVPRDTEIVVVDDASGVDTAQILAKYSGITTVTHTENRGNTVAYNTGARAARGDVLVFIDSDVFVPAGGLERLTAVANDPAVGVVGALLIHPQDYSLQHVGVAFDRWVVTHIYAGRHVDAVSFAPLEPRQAVTAALCAVRRDVFESVGGFDETYRDGMEDVDFCLKVAAKHARNVVCTDVRALHIESATRGAYKHVRRTYNYAIFFERWGGRFEVDLGIYIERCASMLPTRMFGKYRYKVINFCATPNWAELSSLGARDRFELGARHDYSGFIAEHEPIDLFRSIPLATHRDPGPLVFTVDHYKQLAGNVEWFRTRRAADIVIDRHANVVSSEEYGHA
jgi:GT2 family glycosyltransferase